MILFAENFNSLRRAEVGQVIPTLVQLRYPGSRYANNGTTPTGFHLHVPNVTYGGVDGGNRLVADFKKTTTGNKYEIIIDFSGIGSTTSGTSAFFGLNVFGLNLTAPISGGTATPITVQEADVGLTAGLGTNGGRLHVVLKKRPDLTWEMITEVTSGLNNPTQNVIRRKNIVPSFELTNTVYAYITNGSSARPATFPTQITALCLLADTPDGKMSDVAFTGHPVTSSDAVDWEFTDSYDSDVNKPYLNSLTPSIVASSSDANIKYTSPAQDDHVILRIAGTSQEPRMFVKAASGADFKLLKSSSATPELAAAPLIQGKETTLTVVESNLITWLDYDGFVAGRTQTPFSDRLANVWEVSNNSVRGEYLLSVEEGPHGSGCVFKNSVTRGGSMSTAMPTDFLQTGAVVQFWVKPSSTATQHAFGIGTGRTSYRYGLAFNFAGTSVTAFAAVENASLAQIASVTVGSSASWVFVTIRFSRSGSNILCETWLNGTKGSNLTFPFTSGYRLCYSGLSTEPVSASASPYLGNLRVTHGTAFDVQPSLPTVASPWPAV